MSDYDTKPDPLLYDIQGEVDEVLKILQIDHDWSEETQEDKILDAVIEQVQNELVIDPAPDRSEMPEEMQHVMQRLAIEDRAYTWYTNEDFERIYPTLQQMEDKLLIWQIHRFGHATLVEFGDQAKNDDLILPREQLKYLIELTEQGTPFSFIKKGQEEKLQDIRAVVDIAEVIDFGEDDLLVVWAMKSKVSENRCIGNNYGPSCGKNIHIVTQPIYMGDGCDDDHTGLLASLMKIARLKQDEIQMYYRKVDLVNNEMSKISQVITKTAAIKSREEDLCVKLKKRVAAGLSNLESLEVMCNEGKMSTRNEYIQFADQLGNIIKGVAKDIKDQRYRIAEESTKIRQADKKRSKFMANIGTISKKLSKLEEEDQRNAAALEVMKHQNLVLRKKYEILTGRSADALYKTSRTKEAVPNPIAEVILPYDDLQTRDAKYYEEKLKKYRRHSQVHRQSIASLQK